MERIKNMEKFETYLCPLCYSKHTDKCSKIEWTSSLSPKQEWRLHNGECDVPEWFLIWSERVYTDAVSNREKEIAEEIKRMPLEYADSNNPLRVIEKILKIILNHK